MNSTTLAIDRFTECDHLVVRQAMAFLPRRELEVVVLRYWEGLSETEVAMALRTDWRTVEKIMANALARLKEICLSRPEFSRSQISPVRIQAEPVSSMETISNKGIKHANELKY